MNGFMGRSDLLVSTTAGGFFYLTQRRGGRQVFLPPVRLHFTRDHGEHRGEGKEKLRFISVNFTKWPEIKPQGISPLGGDNDP